MFNADFSVIRSQYIRTSLFSPSQTDLKSTNRSKVLHNNLHLSSFKSPKKYHYLLPSFRRRRFCNCTALHRRRRHRCCSSSCSAVSISSRCSDWNFVRKKGITRLENEVGPTQKLVPVILYVNEYMDRLGTLQWPTYENIINACTW